MLKHFSRTGVLDGPSVWSDCPFCTRRGAQPRLIDGSTLNAEFSPVDRAVGGPVTLTKRLDDADAIRAISGAAPYSIVLDLSLGTINNLVVTDTLDAGLIYDNNAVSNGPAGLSLPPAQTISTPNDGSAPAVFAYADNATPQEPDVIAPPTLVWTTLPVLNPGQSLTITFRVTATTQVSSIYTNNVETAGTDNGGNVVTDTDSATVTLTTSPGIVVTKTRVTPSPVTQGSQVVYNLTVQNIGDTTLFTVPLVDSYNPTHLQFVGATPSPDSPVPAGTLTWNDLTPSLGDLAPGASGTVVVTFTALYVPGGVTTVNGVQVTGIDTNTTTVTDTDSATVTILSPRLDFDKVVSPTGTISPGQRLDYTICVTNSGNLSATNVVITDFVPFNTTFISGSVIAPAPAVVVYQDNGGAFVGTPPLTTTGLRWTLAELPPGDSTCVGFSVRVNLTISDTASGLAVMASPLGWIVLSGDTTGLEIITRTNLAAPTVTPTPTLTETPVLTPTVLPTPEITSTPEVTLTITPTPAPTPSPVISVTETPAPLPTDTPTPEATATLQPTETATLMPTPTATAIPLLTDTLTPEPTATPAAATDTPTSELTSTPGPTETPTSEPTIEPVPTSGAVLPGWFVAVGLVAVPALYGQPAFQEPITPTDTATLTPETTATANPDTTPTVAVTPSAQPPSGTETAQPVATATASETTVTPIATMTETTVATPTVTPTTQVTTTPEVTGTPEITLTLTPTPSVEPPLGTATLETTPEMSVTPEITATEPPAATTPIAPDSYPIVAFDTVIVNIPNVATSGSDQTPTQTDVVTNPVIRIVDPLLTKVVNPSQASPGDLVSFRLTLDNPSPPSNANATNLVLVDPLPYLVDLVSYNISSAPGGLVDSVTVVTNIVPIIGHPLGITQTVATTITVSVPVLGPDQRVILDLTTRVNNLASPPPQTIRNIAFLTFAEGDVPPVTVAVDVPLPPSSKGSDDDDDDNDGNNVPLPTPIASALPPAIQPAPVLPVNSLPETGTREAQAKDAAVGGVLLLSMVLGLEVAMLFWRARFKRKNK